MIEGVPHPTVTTILGVINKPALVNWASYGARDATMRAARAVYDDVHAAGVLIPGTSFEYALAQRMGKRPAHLESSDTALEIGSLVHARIEAEMRCEIGRAVPVPEVPTQLPGGNEHPAWSSYQAYLAWRTAHAVRPVAMELPVQSARHGYGGTADLVAEVDGVLTVADFKTSKAVYPEYRLQIAAYREAYLEEHPHGAVAEGLILRFPKDPTDTFEAVPVPFAQHQALLGAFLAAKALWEWQNPTWRDDVLAALKKLG
jgi:hypothetical protein